MKAAQWIDLVKSYRQWDSDYRTAKELGLSRNTISMYRSRTPTMDEETSVVVADALEIDPATVVLDQVAERSKSETVREALADCIMQPNDVFQPGYTAIERQQIRDEINQYGAAAANIDLMNKLRKRKKQAGVAQTSLLALLVVLGFTTTTPSAHAGVTDKSTVERLYIMFSFLRAIFGTGKARRASTAARFCHVQSPFAAAPAFALA